MQQLFFIRVQRQLRRPFICDPDFVALECILLLDHDFIEKEAFLLADNWKRRVAAFADYLCAFGDNYTEIFSDGFESGNTTAWSGVAP